MAETADGWRDLARTLETLGAEMLRQARREEWDVVAGLDTQRRALAQRLFAGSPPSAAAPEMRALLMRLLEQQALLMDLGRRHHGELGAELSRFSRGRKARRAYGGH